MDTVILDRASYDRFPYACAFARLDGDFGNLCLVQQPAALEYTSLPGYAAAKITFTSGSTGQPKGVRLAASTLDQVALRLCGAFADIDIARHLCVMPLATLLENVAGIYVPLMLGTTVYVPSLGSLGLYGSSRIDARRFKQTIDTVAAESLILQPQLLRELHHRGSRRSRRNLAEVCRGRRRSRCRPGFMRRGSSRHSRVRGLRALGMRLRRGAQPPGRGTARERRQAPRRRRREYQPGR